MKIKRILPKPTKSFLLLGPRGTGKSTWLRHFFPDAIFLDLLESEKFLLLNQNPGRLEEFIVERQPGTWVIIDEIQRIPALLNEVHRLYESLDLNFGLSGSSARKLKRGGANLLAGRVLQAFMFPLVFEEYRHLWTIDQAIEWGSVPIVVDSPEHRVQTLSSYVETYLKEEVSAEALVRQLDPFIKVLKVVGLYNGQILNIEKIAREASVKRNTVDRYFQILEDTLLASRLPAVQLGLRKKETHHPKFFMFDNGVARVAAGLGSYEVDSPWKGYAFENLIYQELRAYNHFSGKNRGFFHYAVSNSFDVDLMIELKPKTLSAPKEILAVEVKNSKHFKSEWLKPLKAVMHSDTQKSPVKRSILVYRGRERLLKDKVEIVPVETFLTELQQGKIF